MSKQLELFPELNWKEYEYQGKIYRRYSIGQISYRRKIENKMKINRFINEYKKEII